MGGIKYKKNSLIFYCEQFSNWFFFNMRIYFLSVFNSISSLILHFTTECHDKKPLRIKCQLFCLIAYRLLLWNKNYYSCQYICQPNPFYPQNEVWHFCDIEIDGDVKKSLQMKFFKLILNLKIPKVYFLPIFTFWQF